MHGYRPVKHLLTLPRQANVVLHELNNALSAVTAFGRFAQEALPKDHVAEPDLERAMRAVGRAGVLVAKLGELFADGEESIGDKVTSAVWAVREPSALPASTTSPLAKTTATGEHTGAPLRVLMVEDSELDGALIARHLSEAFRECFVRRVDNAEALEEHLRDQPWDLLISDHQMPNFDSSQALSLLQASGQDIPFIIVSGSIGEERAVAALQSGADDYVLKQNLRRLVPAVERGLRETAARGEKRAAERALHESEERLRKSEQRFQDLFEFAADAIVKCNPSGTILLVNQQTEQIFGYSRQELAGQNIDLLLPAHQTARGISLAQQSADALAAEAHPTESQQTARRKSSSEFQADVRAGVIHAPDGLLLTFTIRDITARLESEAALRQSLHRQQVLLQEVHHRVKNNLQIISSILALQASQTLDVSVHKVLFDSNLRIRSIALIHEMLQDSTQFGRVEFGSYARALISHLVRSCELGSTTSLELDLEPVELNVETAMPCGLILNELVTNVFKYGHSDGTPDRLRVSVTSRPKGGLCLTVEDSGAGLPPDYNIETAQSLGMQLVNTLTQQLKGHLEVQTRPRTRFTLTCQELEYAER